MSVSKVFVTLCVSAYLLLVSGCATLKEQSVSTVDIATNVRLKLTLPPESLVGQNLSQLMTISYGQTSHQMLVQVAFEQNRLIMVAVSVQGVPLFELEMDALGKVALRSYISLPDLNPMYVLADIQLTHWPIDALTSQLLGGSVRATADERQQMRELVVNDEVVVRIHKDQKSTQFEHLERHYQLQLTDMEE
ncbi:DUF3261 domain-containing protein [Thalassotalea fusca]